MIIDKRNVKSWSRFGMRATFGLACYEIAENNENLMVLTADVSTSAGLDRFRKTFPEKFIDVGIAEQNMIGIATGFASENYDVITTTFATFHSMRCLEQIRVNIGYMQNKVVMVGLASGVVLGTLGNTHCSIEDIGVFRSIPNIAIVAPCDGAEIFKALNSALRYEKSVYIRLTGGTNVPIINSEDYEFEIGKAIKLKEGNDITLIANGLMVQTALEVADILSKKNINCKIYNSHTIKPLDKEMIKDAQKTKLIVSIEEHNILGGLSSAIADENVKSDRPCKQISFGINDIFPKPMEYETVLKECGLDAENIANKILENI